MQDNNQNAEPVSLENAVEMMRADVTVRDDWRSALLRDVSSAPLPSTSATLPEVARPGFLLRPFVVRPVAALAACALAMVGGSLATLAVANGSSGSSADTGAASQGVRLVPTANAGEAPNGRQTIIRFALVAPGAKSVSIVGDFNGWNPRATPLASGKDGTTWLVEMPLSAGRHVYAFVVDGDLVTDPSAPRVIDHDFGVQNSVVLVGAS